MLVFVNRLADAVFAVIQVALLGLGEMAIVLRHVFLLGLLQIGFAVLEICTLLRIQLAVFDAISDALLLASFATIDLIDARMARIDHARAGAGRVAGCGLSSSGTSDHQSTDCQG